jgi:hypothetical protein
MENNEIVQIIRRETRFNSFLIVVMNLLMVYELHQLRNLIEPKLNETNAGIFLSIFFSAAFTVVALVKKPLEVVDLRPAKNVDLT